SERTKAETESADSGPSEAVGCEAGGIRRSAGDEAADLERKGAAGGALQTARRAHDRHAHARRSPAEAYRTGPQAIRYRCREQDASRADRQADERTDQRVRKRRIRCDQARPRKRTARADGKPCRLSHELAHNPEARSARAAGANHRAT